jgi:hypothetical protein
MTIKTLFLFLFIYSAPAVFAAGGTDVGRGGDSIALDFRSVANYDLSVIRQNPALLGATVDIGRLEATVESTHIEVQDRVFLQGVEKDAINFSDPSRIVVAS